MKSYSARLAWSTPHNNYSELLKQRRAAGAELCDLTVTNPTQVLSSYPHSQIAGALGGIHNFAYEPNPLGTLEARVQIAQRYAAQGISIPTERIALTASTSEAYAILFKLLCDPGDEVLVPSPSYPLFDYLARAEAVNLVSYRLGYDGCWFIDFDSLRRALSAKTRAIVIVNPNNPTGSFLSSAELAQLTELAVKHSVPVISDEVFETYAVVNAPDQVRSLASNNEMLSFSLNGLSKEAGMPQMKLGWIVVNGRAAEAEQTLAHLELLLDNYLSVGTPVQNALKRLLEIGAGIHAAIQQRLEINRSCLRQVLRDSAVHPLTSQGGWSTILRLPDILSEEAWITQLLQNQALIVQPGYFFDMASEPFAVVSLITPENDFFSGVSKLREMAASL